MSSLLASVSGAQSADSLRLCYRSYIGVRERTNRNDGDEVERFLSHVGLTKGAPWCAAFVSYCFYRAGYVSAPRTGWSPSFFRENARVWEQKEKSTQPNTYTPKVGDLFGIWYAKFGRIAHVGFVDVPNVPSYHKNGEKAPRNALYAPLEWITTVEGNTNDDGSREGVGVFCKRRSLRTIKYIARYAY